MKKIVRAMAVSLAMSAMVSNAVAAGCFVEEAAKAALDKEIELIKATATDVDATFNGPEGCIDSSIFQDFDLSTVIPDLSGMLSNLSGDFIQNAINAAKAKVCKEINKQINDVVGKAKDRMSDFTSGLSEELQGVLDNGWGDL